MKQNETKCIQRSSSLASNAAALAPLDAQLPFGLKPVRLDWISMSHTLLSEHCALNSSADTLKTFAVMKSCNSFVKSIPACSSFSTSQHPSSVDHRPLPLTFGHLEVPEYELKGSEFVPPHQLLGVCVGGSHLDDLVYTQTRLCLG